MTYDWKHRKVAIYLTPADLIYLTTTAFKGVVRVAKATGGEAGAEGTRSLTLQEGDAGTWTLTVAAGGGTAAPQEVTVTMSAHEVALLRHLMNSSVVWLSGWMYQLDPHAFDPAFNLAPETGGGAASGGAASGGATEA